MRQAKINRRQVFVELYAGSGGVSCQLRALGYGAIAFEINHGEHFDLLNRTVNQILRGWISGGVVRGMHLGTPCGSWSRARRGPAGSAWAPIRSSEHIWGLPNLAQHDAQKVKVGNRTLRQSCQAIASCVKLGIPVSIENPVNSLLWQAPPMAQLLQHPSCRVVTLDQCAWQARWRKRTRIAAWNAGDLCHLHKLCSGSAQQCTFTGKPHILLSGRIPGSSKLWTSLAQEYPKRLSKDLAKTLCKAADNLQLARLMQFSL